MTRNAAMPAPSTGADDPAILYDGMQNRAVDERSINPTQTTYSNLGAAYDFFNTRLFQDRLPRCLITYQRPRKARGVYRNGKFITADRAAHTDEIALNPKFFHSRSTEEVLSTLVHEMTHLEQFHFGEPSRNGYHNRKWVRLMERVGLIASKTGKPGGKQTGQQMTHYILPDGAFDRACRDLLNRGFTLTWGDAAAVAESDDAAADMAEPKNTAKRLKFRCPCCAQTAWGVPQLNVVCGNCDARMSRGRFDASLNNPLGVCP